MPEIRRKCMACGDVFDISDPDVLRTWQQWQCPCCGSWEPLSETKAQDTAPQGTPLEMWTVYERPADYPGYFVARKFVVNKDGAFVTSDALFAQTLEALRAKLPPHLFCMPRH